MITFDVKELKKALTVVSNTVGTGDDIFAYFVFAHENGKVKVLSSNGRVFSHYLTEVEAPAFDPFSVEAKRFKSWVAVVKGDTVSLSLTDGSVKASVERGSISFPSLPVEDFPFWDEVLQKSQKTGEASPEMLKSVLDYVKLFISTEDTRVPHLCVAEAKKGCFYATDLVSAVKARIPSLEDVNIRIHGKDMRHVLGFLSQVDEDSVEILEHGRCFFLQAGRYLFGETRFNIQYPEIEFEDEEESNQKNVLDKKDILDALDFLIPGSNMEDSKAKFDFSEKTATLSLSAVSGDPVSLEIQDTEAEGVDPYRGVFSVDYRVLKKILASLEDGAVEMGWEISQKNADAGWVFFKKKDPDYSLYSVVVWL